MACAVTLSLWVRRMTALTASGYTYSVCHLLRTLLVRIPRRVIGTECRTYLSCRVPESVYLMRQAMDLAPQKAFRSDKGMKDVLLAVVSH
jgi:hypothetical protein